MQNKHQNKFKMYQAVKAFFESCKDVLNTLPGFPDFLAQFLTALISFEEAVQQQIVKNAGIKDVYDDLKKQLVDQMDDMLRKVKAYASFTNNKTLLAETSYSKSELLRSGSGKLIEIVKGLIKKMEPLMPELESYGIASANLAQLKTLVAGFDQAVPASRLARAETKQQTMKIENSIKIAEEALTKVDLAIEIIRLPNSDCYNKYKTLRKNINYGTNSLALKGKVVDIKTKKPIKNVDLRFILKSSGNGNGKLELVENYEPLVKRTAEKGGFTIKSMPDGIYELTVSKNGYQTQVLSIAIVNGELQKINVELVRE